MKKIYIAITIMSSIVAMPASAYAGMSESALEAEITRLLTVAEAIRAKLYAFGDNPGTVTPTTPTTPTTPVTPTVPTPSGCLRTTLTMRPGQSGLSIQALQQFLTEAGVYTGGLSGYYGPVTQRGVEIWQGQYGLVSSGTPETTGYGAVGPRTLMAMRAGCGTLPIAIQVPQGGTSGSAGTVERYSLAVNPTSGDAPLSVTASLAINGSTCTSYALDWGDRSLPVSYDSRRSTGCVSLPVNLQPTHTYDDEGTYTLTLRTNKGLLGGAQQVGQFTIEVR